MLVNKQEDDINVESNESLYEKVKRETVDIGDKFCKFIATEMANYWDRIEKETGGKPPSFSLFDHYIEPKAIYDSNYYHCVRLFNIEINNSLYSDAKDLTDELVQRLDEDQDYSYYAYHGVFPGVEGDLERQYTLAVRALYKNVKNAIKSDEFTKSPEFEDFYSALKEIREAEKKL